MTEDFKSNPHEAGDTNEPSAARHLLLSGSGLVLNLILVVTAAHAWVMGWPGRLWVTLGVAAAVGGGAALFRRWPGVPAVLGGGGLALLLLIPAYLYGVDGAGLPIALVPFPTLASALFLLSLGLSAWIIASVPRLPIWARLIPAGVGVYAAIPVVLGLMESLPFGEVLVGIWTWPYWIQGAWVGAAVLLPIGFGMSLAGGLVESVRPARFPKTTLLVSAGGLLGITLLTGFEMNHRGLANLAGLLGSGNVQLALQPSEAESHRQANQMEPEADHPPVTHDRQEILEKHLSDLEEGFSQLAEARSPTTVESLVSQLGTDPEVLLGWVRDSTQWVPYRGALRGASGVLGERVGNALDRAWLLYELLRASGAEVRLARGTRTPQEVQALLEELATRGLARPSQNGGGIAKLYAELLPLDQDDLDTKFRRQAAEEEEREALVRGRVAAQTSDILEAMDPVRGVSAGQEPWGLEEEAWWVQMEVDSGWKDLRLSGSGPQEPSPPPDLTLEPKTILDLDPDLLHRVEVRLVVEGWSGGSPRDDVVLEYSLVPAESGPVFLTLGHAPTSEDFTSDDSFSDPDLFDGLEGASAWQPILLVDGSEVLGKSFSWGSPDSGTTSEPEAEEAASGGGGSAGLGGLFGSRSRKSPTETRTGRNPDAPTFDRVTAEWIEYEIQVPGESPRTIRRPLFDLLGPSRRGSLPKTPPQETDAGKLDRSMALLGTTDILVLPGDLPDLAMEAQILRGGDAAIELMRQVLASKASDPEDLMAALGSSYRASSALLSLASARRKWSPGRDQTYLSEVNILSQHRWLVGEGGGDVAAMEGFDIVANRVSSLPGSRFDPFQMAVQQGVLDTNAEAVLITQGMPVANVALLHEAASRRGVDWVLLQTPEDPSLEELNLPDDLRARIRNELLTGALALVPERALPVRGESSMGWWRIDPATGETLGMGPSGWGQAMVQRGQMEGTTRTVTPMWVKAFRATMDMFWCFVKETGSYINKANASVVMGPTKEESEEYVVNSFGCIWNLNCQFFDIGAVPTGAAVCEVVDQFLDVLEELPQ